METTTLALTDFLLARIAEDEAAARIRADVQPAMEAVARERFGPGATRRADAYGPARALADCEAKRRIVDGLTPHEGAEGRYDFGVTEWGVMRLLALPYADHPDYREEWKP